MLNAKKEAWLNKARQEIKNAQERMDIEFESETPSKEELQLAKDLTKIEVDYISFLLTGIDLMGGNEHSSLVDDLILKSRIGGGVLAHQ